MRSELPLPARPIPNRAERARRPRHGCYAGSPTANSASAGGLAPAGSASRRGAPTVPTVAIVSGASGVPGASLMIRKRTTSSAIRSVRLSVSSSSGVGVELQQVVLGARLVVDRVRQRAHAPLVVAQELALGLDRRARVSDDLARGRILDLGVEQNHEIVCRCGQGHALGARVRYAGKV